MISISRWNALLWLVLIVASASGLYTVKYRVQAIQTEVTKVTRDLEQERESLRVVEAEWAYLTRPERIQKLATRYLKLQPVQTRQIASDDTLRRATPRVQPVTPAAAYVTVKNGPAPAEGE